LVCIVFFSNSAPTFNKNFENSCFAYITILKSTHQDQLKLYQPICNSIRLKRT